MSASSDVLIAGGGPAGAALAILAGRAGISVSLFDGARFPRDKPCGEGLMPAGVAALDRLGMRAATGGARIDGIRYRGFGVTAETAFPAARNGANVGAYGLGQRRLVFDQVLWQAACATPNVRAFEGTPVDGVVFRGARAVGLRAGGQTIAGGLIVGADGARSVVRRTAGLDVRVTRSARWGLRMHFRLASDRPPPTFVEVFVGEGHELYLTPLPAGEVLVAVLSEHGGGDDRAADERAADRLRAFADRHPALAERLRGATPVSTPRGRSPLAASARAGVAPGLVLLGDAAGFTDPLTGGGMAQALLSAELLATYLPRALADRDDEWLWRFDQRRRALLRDYVWLTRVLVEAARRPLLAHATLRGMRAFPGFMRHLVGVAAGTRRLVF